MVILLVGKVVEAFLVILLRESATLSCWDLRSLVPVWMIIWLGDRSSATVKGSRALWVLGHQIYSTLCLGKSVCSSRNLPLESMSRIISALLPLCVCAVSVECGESTGAGVGAWLWLELVE